MLKMMISNKEDRAFFQYCLDDGVKMERILNTHNKMKDYKQLLKNNKIMTARYIENYRGTHSFEMFNDAIEKAILTNNAKKYAKSVFSSKNKHLINEDTEKLLISYSENNVSKEYFKSNIGRKISAFKTSDELNNVLSKELDKLIEWSMYKQKNKVSKFNASIISSDNNSLFFEVHDFEASKALGTDMWCLVREEDTFEDYRDDVKRVFFKYNFNEKFEDNNSMTAYIALSNGDIREAYFKNDEAMDRTEIKEQNAEQFINIYSYNDFKSRIEVQSPNESDQHIHYYLHNLEDQLKDHIGEENITFSKESIKNVLAKSNFADGSKSLYLRLLKDKEFMEDKKDSLNEIATSMGYRYGYEQNEVLAVLLEDDDYERPKTARDLITYLNFEITPENIIKFLQKEKIDFKDFLLDEIRSNDMQLDFSLNKILQKNDEIDIFDEIKNNFTDEELLEFIQTNWIRKDNLFDNPEIIKTAVKIYNDNDIDISEHFFTQLQKEALKNGVALKNELEFMVNDTLHYIKSSPNKIFVKAGKIKKYDIHLGYEDSCLVLKKFLFNDVFDYQDYDKEDIKEDLVYYNQSERNSEILFQKNGFISEKAKQEMIDYLNDVIKDSKNESAIKTVKFLEDKSKEKNTSLIKEEKQHRTLSMRIK